MKEQGQRDDIDGSSIQDMIQLLQDYEKMCLDKNDFSSADEAKTKIQFLKTQDILLRKEQLANQ